MEFKAHKLILSIMLLILQSLHLVKYDQKEYKILLLQALHEKGLQKHALQNHHFPTVLSQTIAGQELERSILKIY